MANPVFNKELIDVIVSIVRAKIQEDQEDMEPPVVYFLDLDDMLQDPSLEAEWGEWGWKWKELWVAVLSETDETGTVSVGVHVRAFGRSLGPRNVVLACYLPVAEYQAGDQVRREQAIEKAHELEQVVLEYLRSHPRQFTVSRGVIPVGKGRPIPGGWAEYEQKAAQLKRQITLAAAPPITSLDLSARVRNRLRIRFDTVGQLLDYVNNNGLPALLRIPHFGEKALAEVKQKLIEHGYLAQDGKTILWPPEIAGADNADHRSDRGA